MAHSYIGTNKGVTNVRESFIGLRSCLDLNLAPYIDCVVGRTAGICVAFYSQNFGYP